MNDRIKSRCGKTFKAIAFLAVVFIFIVFAFMFNACNSVSNEPQNPNGTDLFYSQSEQIGWANSLANFENSQYSAYKNDGEPAFVIPGLSKGENFVLQGVAYVHSKNWTLLCCYINPATDKNNSVIFVMDMSLEASASNGQKYNGVLVKEIFLQNTDGTAFTGHAGGITATEKNVWVSNGKKLLRLPLSDIESSPKSAELKFADAINVPVLSSYCSYFDGILWVGEFEYAKDKYTTDATHHNDENPSLTAWTVGYVIDESGADGFDSVTGFRDFTDGSRIVPDFVLWHGQKVQGMTEAGNKIVLSTSYGRKNDSVLYIYDNPIRSGAEASITVEIYEKQVPCYILADAVKQITAPPMTEDLSVKKVGDGYKVFVASESGAYYYHGYNLFNQSKNATDFVWLYAVEQ